MALLFKDGFDHYTTTAQADLKWDAATTLSSILTSGGRFGGGAAHMTSITHFLRKTVTSAGTMIAGASRKIDSNNGTHRIFRFNEGAVIHVEISHDSSGAIVALRGGSTAIGTRSAPGIIKSGVWQRVEAKVLISDTVGTVDVYVEGINVLALTTLDTRNGGASGVIDNVDFRGTTPPIDWDDCYIADTTGSAPQNDALGDLRIDNLMPDGDGNYTEFGTTTGTPHSGEVDEIPPDSNTTKVTSTAANQRDTFTMANLAAITSQTIFGVQQFSFAQHDGAATNFRNKLRISGSDFDGASQAGGAVYGYFLEEWDLDPNAAGAWVESVINGLESGVESL